MNTVVIGWPLVVVLVVLAAAAAGVTRFADLGRASDVLVAGVRAVAQLAAVSLVIGFVLRSLALTAGFLLVMVTVAAGTSAHRITGSLRPRSWWTAVPILVGIVPTLAVILLSTAVPLEPIAILPSAGILIGGAMTATSIAGRRATEELTAQRGSYEAALSIGLTRREGVSLVARPGGVTTSTIRPAMPSLPPLPLRSSEACCNNWRPAFGMRARMPAMINRLMPLPMPNSSICSPSHMRNMVPAVIVSTVVIFQYQTMPPAEF